MDQRRGEGNQTRPPRGEAQSSAIGHSVEADDEAGTTVRPGEGGSPAALESRARRAQAGRKSSGEIERDIARTRHQMDDTFGEIQRRLRPERLRRQAKHAVRDTFRESAQSAGDRMLNTIKQNPIPSLLTGVGLSWLLARGASDSGRRGHDRYHRRGYYEDDYDRYAPEGYYADAYGEEPYYHDEAHYVAERERADLHADEGSGSSASERAGEKADQARRQASQVADRARRTAQRYGRQARHRAQRAETQMERWMEENPLAVGAATLAIGAFTGLMFPSTRREDEMMGRTRDRTLQEAEGYAREAAERGRRVAQKAAEEAKETAKDEGEREKERAAAKHSDDQ